MDAINKEAPPTCCSNVLFEGQPIGKQLSWNWVELKLLV